MAALPDGCREQRVVFRRRRRLPVSRSRGGPRRQHRLVGNAVLHDLIAGFLWKRMERRHRKRRIVPTVLKFQVFVLL